MVFTIGRRYFAQYGTSAFALSDILDIIPPIYYIFREVLIDVSIALLSIVLYSHILHFHLPRDGGKREKSHLASAVPKAKPFFPNDSNIVDFYDGNLGESYDEVFANEAVFLMLYAPWDSKSQLSKEAFRTACAYFADRVYCAAVNCWISSGSCRKQHVKVVDEFPVLSLKMRGGPVVKYTGLHDDPFHTIRFLESALNPLHVVSNFQDIRKLRTSARAVVVARLSFWEPDYSLSYEQMYRSSLSYLEVDPRRDIKWAVVANPQLAHPENPFASEEYDRRTSIRLILWNETLIYPGTISDVERTSEEIVSWVKLNARSTVDWIYARRRISDSLWTHIRNGPTLVLFTPRNVFMDHVPAFDILRQVSLELQNCDNDTRVANLSQYFSVELRSLLSDYEELKSICEGIEVRQENETDERIEQPTQHNPSGKGYSVVGGSVDCRRWRLLNQHFDSYSERPFGYLSQLSAAASSMDAHAQVTSCLARTTNATFSFAAMDSLRSKEFATAIGINLDTFPDSTAALIIDNPNESIYTTDPQTPFTKVALTSFVSDYLEGKLARWLKSSGEANLRASGTDSLDENRFVVDEIDGKTFERVVSDQSVHVVVYYYSLYCAHCQFAAGTFLAVASALKTCKSLKFVRYDGENNDIAWHLTAHSYPAIVLYSRDRKSNSIHFNTSNEINFENLMDFILSNVEPEIKLQHNFASCFRQTKNGMVANTRCASQLKKEYISTVNSWLSNKRRPLADTLRKVKFVKSLYESLLFVEGNENDHLFPKVMATNHLQ